MRTRGHGLVNGDDGDLDEDKREGSRNVKVEGSGSRRRGKGREVPRRDGKRWKGTTRGATEQKGR